MTIALGTPAINDFELMKLGFLASKNGSNMQAIIDACADARIPASPSLLICNNPTAFAATRARAASLIVEILNSATHPNPDDLDHAIEEILLAHQIDLVVLAGYMKRIGKRTLSTFSNRILNIHPSLLPKFGGRGMYGTRVHEAVIRSGEKETGATVHLVNEDYDDGPILQQRSIAVDPNDTPVSLQKRVLKLEHSLYPDTIAKIAKGEIILPGP